MIGNIDDVKRWNRRGVFVIFCNVWCREHQGKEPHWIGNAATSREQCRIAALAGRRASYFVGYRLRIRLKPGAF